MPQLQVIILGGGLAGGLLGNGLLRAGISVTVYERDSADKRREGYQIRLGEPSLTGFRACLSPELIAQIEAKYGKSKPGSETESVTGPLTAPHVYSKDFEPCLDLSAIPNYTITTAINRVVLRNFLLEPLRQQGHIKFQKRFSHYEIVQDATGVEKVQVHFADGSSDYCDILIAADGSGSQVNQQIGLNNIVDIDTHDLYLARGSLSHDKLEKLPPVLLKQPLVVYSKGSCLYYALYMPQKSNTDDDRENKLFNYDETEAGIFFSLSIPRTESRLNYKSTEVENLQICLDYTKDWAPEFKTMLTHGIADTEGGGVTKLPIRASKTPSRDWRKEAKKSNPHDSRVGNPRVWLVGDAVHPMQPNRGMGGNQALRDCADILPFMVELDKLFRNKGSLLDQDILPLIRSYEDGMIERAFEWVEKSGGSDIPYVDVETVEGAKVWLKTFYEK